MSQKELLEDESRIDIVVRGPRAAIEQLHSVLLRDGVEVSEVDLIASAAPALNAPIGSNPLQDFIAIITAVSVARMALIRSLHAISSDDGPVTLQNPVNGQSIGTVAKGSSLKAIEDIVATVNPA